MGPLASLAFAGTFVVYNVDRLRDVARDRGVSPLRTAFVKRNARALRWLTVCAAVAAGASALQLGPGAWAVCGGVLALGLLHRRLKRGPILKSLYVTAAWLAVVVGLPALGSRHPAGVAGELTGWIAGGYACAVGANLIASNLRTGDAGRESGAASWGPVAALWLARALVAAGALAVTLGPATVRPLALVPGCELASLAFFRSGERYGLAAVDGALLVGAVLALAGPPS